MNFDRYLTAGLLLGLFTGIIAFDHGTRTASTHPYLAPQSLPQHRLHSAGQQSELTTIPASGLGVGP
jgi:hypothetical protein